MWVFKYRLLHYLYTLSSVTYLKLFVCLTLKSHILWSTILIFKIIQTYFSKSVILPH